MTILMADYIVIAVHLDCVFIGLFLLNVLVSAVVTVYIVVYPAQWIVELMEVGHVIRYFLLFIVKFPLSDLQLKHPTQPPILPGPISEYLSVLIHGVETITQQTGAVYGCTAAGSMSPCVRAWAAA